MNDIQMILFDVFVFRCKLKVCLLCDSSTTKMLVFMNKMDGNEENVEILLVLFFDCAYLLRREVVVPA